jgi:hypothetical protein
MSEQVFGESRAPAAEILSKYSYQFMRPSEQGVLQPSSATLVDGQDLFAVLRNTRGIAFDQQPSPPSRRRSINQNIAPRNDIGDDRGNAVSLRIV